MSHFSVAIISENPNQVEKLLAPYQENNMGDCPKEYLAFTSTEEDNRNDYKTGSVTKVKTPDGRLIYPWDEEFRKPGTFGHGSDTHEVPEGKGYEKIETKYTELYPTFEEYMKDFCDSERDTEKGEYGYWENPNKKWDWWQIGGRYSGLITTKSGRRVDQCQIKESDFLPNPKAYDHAIRFWEVNVEGQDLRPDENKTDYFNFYKPEYYTERYESKVAYAAHRAAFSTWAMITLDGQWHEQGEMGWFGLSDATSDSTKSFAEMFNEIIKTANPEFYITIVDCHI